MKPEQLEIARLRREVTTLKAERDILKKPRPTSRRNRREVRFHCEVPGDLAGGLVVQGGSVSRAVVLAWLTQPRSQRSRSDEELGAKVHASFLASDRTYAARRVWKGMLAEGLSCGLHRIEFGTQGMEPVSRGDRQSPQSAASYGPTRESNAQRNKHNRFIFLETWRLAIDASPLRLIIKIIIISSATHRGILWDTFSGLLQGKLRYRLLRCRIAYVV
jgi:hypothetical protein